MPTPLFDTTTPLAPLRDQLQAAVAAVLDDGRYILGPDVHAFEREFADYLGVEHVVGVANGTDALTIALRAAGVGDGDEVVVPSFTFYASAEAIPPTGATPVFCDVDPNTQNVTIETVPAALTPRRRNSRKRTATPTTHRSAARRCARPGGKDEDRSAERPRRGSDRRADLAAIPSGVHRCVWAPPKT